MRTVCDNWAKLLSWVVSVFGVYIGLLKLFKRHILRHTAFSFFVDILASPSWYRGLWARYVVDGAFWVVLWDETKLHLSRRIVVLTKKQSERSEINDVCYPDRHQNSNLPDGWINSLPRTCLLIFWKRDFISSSNNQVGNKRGELLKHRPRFVCNRSSLRNLVDDWTCWKLCARVSTASVRHTAFNKRINQKTGHLILVSGNNSRWIPLSR